jgi:hypothetical protein
MNTDLIGCTKPPRLLKKKRDTMTGATHVPTRSKDLHPSCHPLSILLGNTQFFSSEMFQKFRDKGSFQISCADPFTFKSILKSYTPKFTQPACTCKFHPNTIGLIQTATIGPLCERNTCVWEIWEILPLPTLTSKFFSFDHFMKTLD